MTPRVTVGIVALARVSVFGVVASLINFEMMDKVNEKLSEREQFTALGWYFSKYQRLHREYQRLYPDGRLRRKFDSVTTLRFTCLLISVRCSAPNTHPANRPTYDA